MNKLSNNIQTEFEIVNDVLDFRGSVNETRKVIPKKTISLTERDYKLLKFILEMKFSSLNEVYLKFFKATSSDGSQLGTSYAIRRLAQLKKEGFLKSTRAFDATLRLYYVTPKAFEILNKIFPEENLIKPAKMIDGRTVVHDYYVLKMRLKLESEQNIKAWVSDRTLKADPELMRDLGTENNPDGIYFTSNNEKIAFELEVSVKSKIRYQNKVNAYINLIRKNYESNNGIKKIHYVVFSEITLKKLITYTAMYREFFKIELASTYNLEKGILS